MNESILMCSFKYLKSYELISSLCLRLYSELSDINYSDNKLIKSFKKQDIDVTRSIIKLNSNIEVLNTLFIDFFDYNNVTRILDKLFEEHGFVENTEECLVSKLMKNHTEMIRILLEHNVNIDAEDGLAMIVSFTHDYVEMVELLIDYRINIRFENDWFLRYACLENYPEFVKLAIDKGADVHHYNNIIFKHAHNPQIIDMILTAAINVIDANNIVLLNSCTYNNIEAVKVSLRFDATNHQEALKIAQQNNFTMIVDLIDDFLKMN